MRRQGRLPRSCSDCGRRRPPGRPCAIPAGSFIRGCPGPEPFFPPCGRRRAHSHVSAAGTAHARQAGDSKSFPRTLRRASRVGRRPAPSTISTPVDRSAGAYCCPLCGVQRAAATARSDLSALRGSSKRSPTADIIGTGDTSALLSMGRLWQPQVRDGEVEQWRTFPIATPPRRACLHRCLGRPATRSTSARADRSKSPACPRSVGPTAGT